jgi:hypothetical protein
MVVNYTNFVLFLRGIMMRFREITSLLLLLSLVLTLFTSCKSGNTDSSNSDAGSTEQTVNIKQRVNFERYKKEVKMPFAIVASPFKYGDFLYFSAAEKGSADPATNKLIKCDLKAKVIETLYEIPGERCNISDISANENYIVWMAFERPALYADMYLMDLKDGSVKMILNDKEFTFGLAPVLMDDCVYWLEENKTSDGKTENMIVCYNCKTNDRIELQKLNQVSMHNDRVFANEGFVVWADKVGSSYYYFLFNTKTGKTASYKAKGEVGGNVQYAKGFIFATEFDGFDDIFGTTRIINTVTGQDVDTSSLCIEGDVRLVSGSFIVSTPGLLPVHQIKDGEIKLLGTLPDYLNDRAVFASQPDCFICYEEVPSGYEETEEYLNSDKKLYIFDLGKLAK